MAPLAGCRITRFFRPALEHQAHKWERHLLAKHEPVEGHPGAHRQGREVLNDFKGWHGIAVPVDERASRDFCPSAIDLPGERIDDAGFPSLAHVQAGQPIDRSQCVLDHAAGFIVKLPVMVEQRHRAMGVDVHLAVLDLAFDSDEAFGRLARPHVDIKRSQIPGGINVIQALDLERDAAHPGREHGSLEQAARVELHFAVDLEPPVRAPRRGRDRFTHSTPIVGVLGIIDDLKAPMHGLGVVAGVGDRTQVGRVALRKLGQYIPGEQKERGYRPVDQDGQRDETRGHGPELPLIRPMEWSGKQLRARPQYGSSQNCRTRASATDRSKSLVENALYSPEIRAFALQ